MSCDGCTDCACKPKPPREACWYLREPVGENWDGAGCDCTNVVACEFYGPEESTETVLEEAERIVGGSRNAAYGDPAGNHGTTADLWTVYLRRRGHLVDGAALDARDVCWLNVLQKGSRDAFERKRDNLVDVAGYVRNAEMIGP